MSDLKNPMRFSMQNRMVDIQNWLQPTEDNPRKKRVTDIDIRPSEGNLYVYWEATDE